MILKFLKNKKGGSTKSIDYLLDKKRVENGTSKILQGNEKSTRQIINSISKKQKVTFGVLSFEEKDISEVQKKELMEEFEKIFCAGMKKEQFNILWVEHTDKDRLELNFVIPKVELSTGKTFNPYFHKTDFHLADLFQRKANLKYNFSDPKDPKKSSTIQGNKKALGIFRGYRNLDAKLKELVGEGVIQSRDDILEILKNNNIEVTKIENDKIEVKLENSKKPRYLKGGIYKNEFTNIEKLGDLGEEKFREERDFENRDTEKELRETSARLEKSVSKRAEFNKKIYGNSEEKQFVFEEKIGEANEPNFVPGEKQNNQIYNEVELNEFRRDVEIRAREREEIFEQTLPKNGDSRDRIFKNPERERDQLFRKTQLLMRSRGRRKGASKIGRQRLGKSLNLVRNTIEVYISGLAEFAKLLEKFNEIRRAKKKDVSINGIRKMIEKIKVEIESESIELRGNEKLEELKSIANNFELPEYIHNNIYEVQNIIKEQIAKEEREINMKKFLHVKRNPQNRKAVAVEEKISYGLSR